jgi:glutamine synthetase
MPSTEPASAEPRSPGAPALSAAERAERVRQAGPAAGRLRAAGVTMVALCWVDNAGITRVKTIPLGRLERAAGWGVGMSPVFDVFLINDDITTSEHIGGPVGDLRLIPDLDRIAALARQPGWAWAPVDRYTQEGRRGRPARPGAADEHRGGVGRRHRGRR